MSLAPNVSCAGRAWRLAAGLTADSCADSVPMPPGRSPRFLSSEATTNCRRLVLRSTPFTSLSFSSVSSLNPRAQRAEAAQ